MLVVLRMALQTRDERCQHLPDGLMELGLARVLGHHVVEYLVHITICVYWNLPESPSLEKPAPLSPWRGRDTAYTTRGRDVTSPVLIMS